MSKRKTGQMFKAKISKHLGTLSKKKLHFKMWLMLDAVMERKYQDLKTSKSEP